MIKNNHMDLEEKFIKIKLIRKVNLLMVSCVEELIILVEIR